MIYKARPSQDIWLAGINGEPFRLLAIADNDKAANDFTQEHGQAGVFACIGPLVVIADNRPRVTGEMDEAPFQAAAEREGWSGPHTDRFGAQYFEDVNDGQTWCAGSWRELCHAFDIEPLG